MGEPPSPPLPEPAPPPDAAAASASPAAAAPAPPPPSGRPAAARRSPAAAGLAAQLRRAHGAMAPWVLAPLLLTVGSGLAYRLLRDWGGLGRDQAHGLMVIHEGEWLRHWFGPTGETLYVLLNGLGLLWMLGSGALLAWERRRRRPGSVRREAEG